MTIKDTLNENDMSVLLVEPAPVQQVSQSEITAATKRMAVIVADAPNMSTEQLATIAQESILYRTVPGRDVHYFLNRGKLSRVLDYKYLKNFATFKEQVLSGEGNATLDDSYRPLTETERVEHNIGDNFIAAKCTIITKRERDNFGEEVKRWLDMGFSTDQAVKMAKDVLGGLGTSAMGMVPKSDQVPKGWSHMQLAEKLAFKNAVNRKYGQPTADEMAMMAFRMAKLARPEHWEDVDPTLPVDAQAKIADLTAQVDAIESEELTTEEHAERLQKNVSLLRDEDDTPIGEDAIEGEVVETEQPSKPAQATNGNKDPWAKVTAPHILEFIEDVLPLCNGYYTGPEHLSNTIGGWHNPGDTDAYESKKSIAVDHAAENQ